MNTLGVSPHRDFAAEGEADEIRKFANLLERMETIQVHSGDAARRQPGSDMSARGKAWILAGLRLLAASKG